jgi:Gpi18-like mannosyltransferase
LCREQFDVGVARRTIVLVVVFPGAFYFYAGYTHALMLLLASATYWFAWKNRWLLAGLAGLLAGLTHPTAWTLSIILLYFAIHGWRKQPSLPRFSIFLLPLTPVLGIGLFLAWRISNGFIDYGTLQAQNWGISLIPFWQILPAMLDNRWFPARLWINLGLLMMTLALVPLVWRRFGWGIGTYVLVIVIFLASVANFGEPLTSFHRFILPVFPIYPALVVWLKGRFNVLAFISVIFQLFLCGAFVMWLYLG